MNSHSKPRRKRGRTSHPIARSLATVVALTVTGLTACGGSDDSSSGDTTPTNIAANDTDSTSDDTTPITTPADPSASSPAGVSDGATLCGVYTDEYRVVLDSPTPFGEDGWEDEAQELVRLAEVLEQLAPADQSANAAANVGYFQALADVESASELVADSNTFNVYLVETCRT